MGGGSESYSGTFSGIPTVGALHCEIPVHAGAVKGRAGGGTVDLLEVADEGPTAAEVIPLIEGQVLRIGRGKTNDLVVEHPAVSRFHAVFSASKSGIVLSDLSSLNGTFVNGRRISTPVDLAPGDSVRIGAVRITIELHRGPMQDEEGSDTATMTRATQMSSVEVTVFVADVAGFTRISQDLPPHDVAEMLARWFELVSGLVNRAGGTVDKYIGDCVMALWQSRPSDAERVTAAAVHAAIETLRETKKLVAGGAWKYHATHPWQCRVALNTGEALMGAIGVGSARDFTVLGDAVNIAFRLESIAGHTDVPLIFSGGTARYVAGLQGLRPLGSAIVEGRTENVDIFTVDGLD